MLNIFILKLINSKKKKKKKKIVHLESQIIFVYLRIVIERFCFVNVIA